MTSAMDGACVPSSGQAALPAADAIGALLVSSREWELEVEAEKPRFKLF